jgi:5'-nucleotidase (lipoprotein e(P4) family)
MNMMAKFLFPGLFILFSFGVQSAVANPPLPNDVRWVRNSKEYQYSCTYIFRKAAESVQVQTELPEVVKGKEQSKQYAVVVDLDETVLDNSTYQVERWNAGLGFTQDSWSLWVKRKEAKLVPGSKNFLESVRKNGVRVVFLSNRMHHNLKPTRENLRKLGVLNDHDLFLLRQSKLDTKEIRRAEVLNGTGRMEQAGPFTVVGYIGDQMGDFPSDLSGEIGRKYFLLPNPMYGKW